MRTRQEILEMMMDLKSYSVNSLEQAIGLKASFDMLQWVLGDEAVEPGKKD